MGVRGVCLGLAPLLKGHRNRAPATEPGSIRNKLLSCSISPGGPRPCAANPRTTSDSSGSWDDAKGLAFRVCPFEL